MNFLKSLEFIIVIGGFIALSSCESDNGGGELTKKTGVLIVNEGNFLAGNGSISFYDEEQMTITNNVVKTANDGSEIGATVQSIYIHDGVGYIICNGSDKIEFISADEFKYLANPVTDISVPRYMTTVGDKGYITCWGPFDANYGLPDSYIAVMDLSSMSIVDSLACGSGPEGIIASGNKLYVANSYETAVSVIDLSDNSTTKIDFDAAPVQLAQGTSGTIWVSLSSGWQYPADKAGIQAINTATMGKGTFIPVMNVSGPISIDSDGENIYILSVEPWDGNIPNQASEIHVYNTLTKSLRTNSLISGEDFYGLGYNGTTDKIYVTDSKAFAGPGQMYIYDATGLKLDEQVTGIGPNGTSFK